MRRKEVTEFPLSPIERENRRSLLTSREIFYSRRVIHRVLQKNSEILLFGPPRSTWRALG